MTTESNLSALQKSIDKKSNENCDQALYNALQRFSKDIKSVTGIDITDPHRDGISPDMQKLAEHLLMITSKQQNSIVRQDLLAGARDKASQEFVSRVNQLVDLGAINTREIS